MQRPPGRIGPILSRSPNEWINRVNQRHNALAALGVSADERRRLDAWLVTQFVRATLQLEAVEVTRQAGEQDSDTGMAPEATPDLSARMTEALRDMLILVESEGGQTRLTPERLIRLGGASLRTRDGGAGQAVTHVPAAYLRQTLDAACDWFAVDSFAELNPIEQAAIVFLRLVTIQPFEQANRATALVAASLFTLRAQLPPVTIRPEMQTSFQGTLVEADRMNMQPLVELFAEVITSTLDEMIGFVKQARGGRP